MLAPMPGDAASRSFTTGSPLFRGLDTSQARLTAPPKKVPETLKKLIQNALVPAKLASTNLAAHEVNDAYSWQVAQIGTLFQALYHEGIASENDMAQLQQHRRDLHSLQEQVERLDLSSNEKDHAIKQIRSAHRLIEDTAVLAKSLQQYCSVAEHFDEAEASLVDRCYEPYEVGDPLLALNNVKDAIHGLHALWEPVADCTNREAPASKMFSLFSDDLRHLSYVVEDWADAVGDSVKAEHKALSKWLENTHDPEVRREIFSQLDSLRTQVKEVQQLITRLGPQLDALKKQLKDYPQFKDDLAVLTNALKNASQATSSAHSELSVTLKGVKVPVLKYGSDEWQQHIQQRPEIQHGFLQRAITHLTQPENWNDTTKRVVYGLFTGMQISQQVIGIATEVGRMKQMADQIQNEVIQAVPKDKADQIDKETGALGTFLSDKFEALGNPATFNTLTKKYELLRPALKAALDGTQAPSKDQINQIMGAYRLQRLVQESPKASPLKSLSFGEWWDLITDRGETEPQAIAAAPLLLTATAEDLPVAASAEKCNGVVSQCMSWIGGLWKAHQTPASSTAPPSPFFEGKAHEVQSQLKEAISTTHALQRELTAAPGLEELRAQAALLHRELLMTARQTPKDTCPILELASWTQEVRDKCYSVEALEQRISLLMEQSRDALNVDDAELEKFGKKHMNNIKQARIAQVLHIPGVVVPVPHGFSSELVHQFLQQSAPEVFEHWEALNTLYEKTQNSMERFFELPDAAAHLLAIDQAIARSFNKDNAFDALSPPAEFTEWLNEVKDSGTYLMVRSTGSEDTRQVANAGGNVSKPYVPAEPKAVCEAMGEVIRSYFSYPSLQNRINAGQNPFEHELKLAVTAQQLIGEPIGGASNPSQIPISLVLFTDEPLYSGGEKFRVMRVSATYGHGEAVVGSQGIGTDTAMLLISDAHPDQLYVMYDNKEKPQRLAPVSTPEGVKLGKIANPPKLRNRPALSPELLARLYHWGIVGEAFFDDPATDMEIVIKGDTIYPVQARPIVRQPMLPTYLDMRKIASKPKSPITETLQTEMLVPGKASAMVLSNPDEVLVANTIEDAQVAYRTHHKLVIVKEPPPDNSHPVVNFSGMGMTCLVTNDGNAVDKLVAQIAEDKPLAVCTQTATLNLWDNKKGSAESFISKGFAVHPAKIAISIPISKPLAKASTRAEVPQEVKDFLRAIRSATSQEVALQNLKALQQHSFVQNIQQGKQTLAAQVQAGSEAHKAYTVLEEFDGRLQQAFEEVEAAITNQRGEERLKPLLQVKVLEALLMAPPQSGRSIGQYSVLNISPAVQDTKELVAYQKELSHPAHFAGVLLNSHAALTKQSGKDWALLLKELEPLAQSGEISPEKVQEFKTLLKTVQQADALPQWLTFAFAPINSRNDSPAQKLQALIHSLPSEDFAFIQKQLETRDALQALRDEVSLFANPATFNQPWQTLVSHVSLELQETSAAQMKNASPIAQIVALGTMKELVDVYDLSIKSMKGSTQWPDDQKVPQFKQMLIPYFNLFKSWHNGLIPAEPTSRISWTISSYLDSLQKILLNLPDDDVTQLRETNEFNVNSAVFSSGTDFARHPPRRLDGVFTLIHQNLLKSISSLNSSIIPPDLMNTSGLPDTFKEAMSTIASSSNVLVGLDIDDNEACVTFNKPLRQHSSQLVFRYDKALDAYGLDFSLYGFNEARRWSFVGEMATLMSSAGILPIKKTVTVQEQDEEVAISWAIEDIDTLKRALVEIDAMNALTMQGTSAEKVMGDFAAQMVARVKDDKQRDQLLQDVLSLKSDFAGFFGKALANAAMSHIFSANLVQEIRKDEPNSKIRLLQIANDAMNEGHSYEAGEEAVQMGVNDLIDEVRSAAWTTLGTLVKKGKGQKLAEDILMQEMLNPDESFKVQAVMINDSLLFHTGSSAYEKIAAMGMANPDPWTRMKCMERLHNHVFGGKTSQATLSVLPNAIRDSDPYIKTSAWETLKAIIGRADTYPFPTSVVQQGLKENDDTLRGEYWTLLLDVVKQGKGIDLARQAIEDGLKDPNVAVQTAAKQIVAIKDSWARTKRR